MRDWKPMKREKKFYAITFQSQYCNRRYNQDHQIEERFLCSRYTDDIWKKSDFCTRMMWNNNATYFNYPHYAKYYCLLNSTKGLQMEEPLKSMIQTCIYKDGTFIQAQRCLEKVEK